VASGLDRVPGRGGAAGPLPVTGVAGAVPEAGSRAGAWWWREAGARIWHPWSGLRRHLEKVPIAAIIGLMIGRRTLERLATTLALCCLGGVASLAVQSLAREQELSNLHSQAMSGNTAYVQSYIAATGDREARQTGSRTLLMSAAWQGRVALVKLLIACGADVNTTDEDGRTPLMHAASMHRGFGGGGHLAVAKVLLAAGARPQMRDRTGQDARSLASAQGRIDLVRLLQGARSRPR
jgi:hypothetical protein